METTFAARGLGSSPDPSHPLPSYPSTGSQRSTNHPRGVLAKRNSSSNGSQARDGLKQEEEGIARGSGAAATPSPTTRPVYDFPAAAPAGKLILGVITVPRDGVLQVADAEGSGFVKPQQPSSVPDESTLASKPGMASRAWEGLLTWCVIAIGAYAGSLVRIGFQYFRGGAPSPASFTVMYAQILGCFIMGYISEFQSILTSTAAPRHWRLLYIMIATGLCGSITTFSTWQLESNKLFLMQLDPTYGSIGSNYHGGRALEWLLAIWSGFIIPLAALQGGMHLAQIQKNAIIATTAVAESIARSNERGVSVIGVGAAVGSISTASSASSTSRMQHIVQASLELFIILAYAGCTAAICILTLATGWLFIAYTCLLGSVGAYCRYLLAVWFNTASRPASGRASCGGCLDDRSTGKRTFPLGTFIANIGGSVLLAVVTVVSKTVVSYHDHDIQSLLYAVSIGFCGCLTTMSTFVLELHRLPRRSAYVYAIASTLIAQLGFMVIFDAPAELYSVRDTAQSAALDGPRVSFCFQFNHLCSMLLDRIGCPANESNVVACTTGSGIDDMRSWAGSCTCGTLEATERVTELIIDAQSKYNVSQSLVPVWPSFADVPSKHLYTTDYLDYVKANQVLPPEAPDAGDGAAADEAGAVDSGRVLRSRRLDYARLSNPLALASAVSPTSLVPMYDRTESFDMCLSFENLCDHFLNRIQCPRDIRDINGCNRLGLKNFTGHCRCGSMAQGDTRITELIIDTSLQRRYDLLQYGGYPSAVAGGSVEFCSAFETVCSAHLDHVMCPVLNRSIAGCTTPGDYSTFKGVCACFGSAYNDLPSGRIPEVLMDQFVKPHWWPRLIRFNQTLGTSDVIVPSVGAPVRFDACASYENLCNLYMDSIACPSALRNNTACAAAGSTAAAPAGNISVSAMSQYLSPAGWVGKCTCGSIDIADERAREWVIDGILADITYSPGLTFMPPPLAPAPLMAASNPFRPLLMPSQPLPGWNN